MSNGFRQPSGSYAGPATYTLVAIALLMAGVVVVKAVLDALHAHGLL